MKDILESQIITGDYQLSDMLEKIDIFFASGSLTKDERTQLIEHARSNAEPGQQTDIMVKLMELESRIRALEDAKPAQTETAVEPYQDGKWYRNGDLILWNGKTYICTAPEGVVCVWSPDAYPSYWNLKEEETNDETR